MKPFVHPDPLELEEALISIVAKREDPLAPLLVLAPTALVCRRLRRRLAERFRALLAIEIATHFTLARRILNRAEAPLRLVCKAARVALVREAATGDDELSRFVKRRPDAASYLAASMNELREALVTQEELDAAGAQESYRNLFRSYEARLAQLEESGLSDRAGIVRRAALHAKALVPARTIVQYGAYELVRMNRRLLASLEEGRSVHLLALADAKAPGYAYALRKVESLSAEPCASAPAGKTRRGFVKLACGSCRDAEPEFPGASLTLTETHDSRSELLLVARRILALSARGVPLHDMALVARTMDPYLPLARDIFRDHGIRLVVSRPEPIASDPDKASIAALVFLLAEDRFRVSDLLRLVRSPRWREAVSPDEIEQTARRRFVLEGARSMALAIPGARPLIEALESERRRFRHRSASRASLLKEFILRRLTVPETLAAEAVRPLTELGALDLPPADAGRLVIDHLASTPGQTHPGLAFLDMMQLRGLTYSYLFLVGANADLIPAASPDDPFLSATTRSKLPGLSQPSERLEEEQLLFSMTLAAAVKELHLSWQRTSESGSARFPSGELRRLKGKRQDLPTHSRDAGRFLLKETGLASLQDALLLSPHPDRVLSAYRASLAASSRMNEALRSHEKLPFDGMVSPAKLPPLSVSAFCELCRCPLAFFFHHRLNLRPRLDPLDPLEVPPDRLGAAIHDLMRDLLSPEKTALSKEELGPLLNRLLAPFRGLFSTEPLFAGFRERLSDCLAGQIAREKHRITAESLRIEAVEQSIEGKVGPVHLRARFDRVARGRDGGVITDYKTGGDLALKLKPKQWLTGLDLQAPLYLLLSTGSDSGFANDAMKAASFELVGLGPRFSEGPIPPPAYERTDGSVLTGETLEGFLGMMATIASLHEGGRFPFRRDRWCSYCDFALACRRHDEGSEARVKAHPDHRDFFALPQGKTSTRRHVKRETS